MYSNVFRLKEIFFHNLSRLVQIELSRNLLSLQKDMELIFATVLKVDLPDLKSVISQKVVHNIRRIIENKEFQYFPIILQKLLLISNSSPSQSMFSVFLHIIVSHRNELNISLFKELILRLVVT